MHQNKVTVTGMTIKANSYNYYYIDNAIHLVENANFICVLTRPSAWKFSGVDSLFDLLKCIVFMIFCIEY